MAAITGAVNLTGMIAPTDTLDTYPTHSSEYGLGGFKEVADQTARDAITTQRRVHGMLVFQQSDGKFYQLDSGLTNSDWNEVSLPVDTDSLLEGTTNLYYTDARVASYLTTNNYATQAYADQAEVDAKAYTDTRELAITSAYESYADTAEADAKSYADTQIANLVDSAPTTLDTLNELAAALGDDPNFATTIATDIGNKVAKAGDTMTGLLTLSGAPTANLHAATKLYVDDSASTLTTAYQAYADQAEIDAIATSNAYAFSQDTALIGDATVDGTAGNTITDRIGVKVSKSGDTMTGYLTLHAAPTNTLHAATKAYVDSAVSSGTGALDTDDVPEGLLNLYYTDARVDARLSSGSLGSISTTGNIDVGGNVTVDGDLTVLGTTTTVLSSSTRINENVLYLNEGGDATITNAVGNGSTVTYTATNSYSTGYTVDITGVNPSSFNVINATVTAANSTSFTISSTVTDTYVSGGTAEGHAHVNVDLGWAGAYDDGTYHHAGLFRDATDGRFKVFDSYVPEPSAAPDINTGHASFSLADFQADTFIGNLTGNVTGTVSSIANHSTTSLSEGTNLYYTDARVDARIPTNVSSFTNDSGYLTSETDPVFTASAASGIVAGDITNWNTAYGWGNHASVGYLTSANLSSYATQTYVDTAVANVIDSAPAALDTLNELAAAMGDDANFSATVTNSLAGKVAKAGDTMTGALTVNAMTTSDQIEITTNNMTTETDLILNANAVISSNNSINNCLTDTAGIFRWYFGVTDHATGTGGGTQYMQLNTSGLGVTGTITATGDVCAYGTVSDRRQKENVLKLENALDKVNTLNGYTFNYIGDNTEERMTGVMAQEVQEVLPEAVFETNHSVNEQGETESILAVRHGNMVGLLIEAIKEQSQQIAELKAEVESLKNKV